MTETEELAEIVRAHVQSVADGDMPVTVAYSRLLGATSKHSSLSVPSNKRYAGGMAAGVLLELNRSQLCKISVRLIEGRIESYETRHSPRPPIFPQEILRQDQTPRFFLESLLSSLEILGTQAKWREAAEHLLVQVKVDWPVPSTPFNDDNPYSEMAANHDDGDDGGGDGEI